MLLRWLILGSIERKDHDGDTSVSLKGKRNPASCGDSFRLSLLCFRNMVVECGYFHRRRGRDKLNLFRPRSCGYTIATQLSFALS
jgi:hypothetical protein